MSSESISVQEYMEKEKGIPRVDMIATITNALKTAAQKGVNSGQELKIDINPKNGQLHAWAMMKVVDSVSNPKTEIHVEKAQVVRPGAMVGEMLEKEIDPSSLGRIAAQTARQAVMQRLRQFEKDRIYDDFKDQVGNIVTGTVRRRERNDLYVDLGKAEAVMPGKEQVPGEEYAPGERIRCLLMEIESTPRGPEIILSRASPKFVRRLFELEEPADEFRTRAAENNFRPARRAHDFHQQAADALARRVFLAGDLLLAGHDGLGLAEIDVEVVALAAAHGAGHDVADLVLEVVVDAVLFELAEPLHHGLPRRLRGDAAE